MFNRSTTILRIALAAVAVRAQHLAVLRDRLAALRPRRDVVCLHFLDGEVLAAFHAIAALTRIGGKFLVVVKGPDAQVPLIACKQIRYDAAFLRHILVL